jgi:orotate phosphoribosyltransferase
VAAVVNENSDGKLVIYDQQKAGNDIPDMGANFARAVAKAGVTAVILFPFTGPKTEEEWIKACQGEGLNVIVGGHMTHPRFLESQGGSIADSAPAKIYRQAAEMGVTDFVVPGNQANLVAKYRKLLEGILGENGFTLYAPGFVAQGGEVSSTGRVAGRNWHAIVGRGIYAAEDPKQAAVDLTKKLLETPVEDEGLAAFEAELTQSRQERTMQILRDTEAIEENGHFLLKSGKHSEGYVRKDRVYVHSAETAEVCRMMAENLVGQGIEVVAGPTIGGVLLSHIVASELENLEGRKVLSVFAEKAKVEGVERIILGRDYDQVVAGRTVAVAEDILTTGGSAKDTCKVVTEAGGKVVAVVGIVNRGGVTPEALKTEKMDAAPTLRTLVNIDIPTFEPGPETCPKCKDDVPLHAPGGQRGLTHP